MSGNLIKGSQAQFTYDFGIAIAQSTVSKVMKLTGASLTLASAFYALNNFAKEYVGTLKQSALFFGGYVGTIKAMEDAQKRLLNGATSFSVDDQLKGMNKLMASGVSIKKNFDLINKGAHAMGANFSDFAGAISAGIQGNMQGLVDMGLITQRATRYFEKYQSNTIMREQAIMNFVQKHKGLQQLIKNDFQTIQGQMAILSGSWSNFLKSIVGSPTDKSSFYGQVVGGLKYISASFAKNAHTIEAAGFMIGRVLGWVFKQISHFVVWVGRQLKKSLGFTQKALQNYKETTYELLVVMEFWKNAIVSFFDTYGDKIKDIIKLLLVLQGTKMVLGLGGKALLSLAKGYAWIKGITTLLKGASLFGLGKLLSYRIMRKSSNRMILRMFGFSSTGVSAAFSTLSLWVATGFSKIGKLLLAVLKSPFKALGGLFTGTFGLIRGLIMNLPALFAASWSAIAAGLAAIPIAGWIAAAIVTIGLLLWKCKWFRDKVSEVIGEVKTVLENVFGFIGAAINVVWASMKWLWGEVSKFANNFWKVYETAANKSAKNDGTRFGKLGKYIDKASKELDNMWVSTKASKAYTELASAYTKWLKPIVDAFTWLFTALRDAIFDPLHFLDRIVSYSEKLTGATDSMNKAADKISGKTNGTVPIARGETNVKKLSRSDYPNTPEGNAKWADAYAKVKAENDMLMGRNPLLPSGGEPMDFGGTTVNVTPGAITINVNKGEGWDENKLALKIKEVLQDMERTKNKRGGEAA